MRLYPQTEGGQAKSYRTEGIFTALPEAIPEGHLCGKPKTGLVSKVRLGKKDTFFIFIGKYTTIFTSEATKIESAKDSHEAGWSLILCN